MKKITLVLLCLFLTSLFVLTSLGCPSGAPGSQNSKETLVAVITGFSNALAEMDFATAKTFCTEELWADQFAEMEEGMAEMMDMFSDDEMDEMMGEMGEEFEMEDEMMEGLHAAEAEFDGDRARLLIDDEGEEVAFEFEKVDGKWVISEMDWSMD